MKTVSFFGLCPARSTFVLVSQLITHPYLLRRVRASFSEGCYNLLRLEFLISSDDEAPSTGKPSGSSILSDYGQVDFIVGNSEVVDMGHEVEVPQGGSYLKIYADNRGYKAQDISVQMFLAPIERK